MVTRRDFNGLVLGAGIAAALPAAAPSPAAAAVDASLGETGPLDAATLAVLMATAQAVTGLSSPEGHYEDYYDHHARRHPGYLALYRRYAEHVNRAATRAGYANFPACDGPTRLAIIDRTRSWLGGEKEFEDPIFQETLAVFQRTDVWLLLGYSAWPGSPRGQDSYNEPF